MACSICGYAAIVAIMLVTVGAVYFHYEKKVQQLDDEMQEIYKENI